MKKIIIIVLSCIIVIMGIVVAIILSHKNIVESPKSCKEIKDIRSLNFSYDKGYAMNANVSYQLKYEEERYVAKIKLYGVAEEDAKEVVVNTETVNEIEEILNKYQVSTWDGFKKSNKNVLDGNAFSFSLDYGDKDEISASGYMKWPQNYREVREELDRVFEGLLEK